MCAHLSQLRIRLAVSLLQGPASVCPFAQRAFAQHGGPQWYSKQQSYGFHTAVAAAKRSSDGCRSLNWLALIRTRMHQDNSYSTHVHTRQEPTSERDLPCYRSLAVTSPFLPVLRPAMRYAQTATTTPISPSSSGDSLASMDESTDGSAPVPSASTEAADEWKLEYTGSLSGTIRTLKVVSLATASLSLIGSPLYIFATMDGQFTAVKIMAASGFTCFGLFTTGLLHWFVGPYVHKLWHNAPSKQVKVEMRNVFVQKTNYTFHEDEVKATEALAPLQTFEVKGKVMFIDEASFENKELLDTLTPANPYEFPPENRSSATKQQDD